MLKFLHACSVGTHTNPFFRKHYGFELLLRLHAFGQTDEDNGIDDTFSSITLHQPRREAFSVFCSDLVKKGVIVQIASATKKSKKVLRLSDSAQSQYEAAYALLLEA